MDFRGITEKSATSGGLNRRQFVSTVGLAGVSLGTMGTVSARGERTPLQNEAVDILIYWSSGNDPNNFGYLNRDEEEVDPNGRGLMMALHDPAKGGMFDFRKFELTPNGTTMHNTFELFHGMLLASKPPSYPLVHQGNGRYESRGQVMNFETVNPEEHPFFAVIGDDNPMYQPLQILGGSSLRAVGNDISQLKTDSSGYPQPKGEWGVTRVDIFDHHGGPSAYELSLLYLMWVSEAESEEEQEEGQNLPDIPDGAHCAAQELIDHGLSNPGGQSRGRQP